MTPRRVERTKLVNWLSARGLIIVLMAIALAVPAASLTAEEPSEEQDVSRIDRLKKALEADEPLKFAPELVPPEFLDEDGEEALKRSIKSYYDYLSEGFEHRRRVFAWQLLSSRIIFVLVVALVTVGIYFSWLQFRAGIAKDGEGDGSAPRTTFEATAKGIKVSSPVLGVIILVISLVFFYLYLRYVYPIEEIL